MAVKRKPVIKRGSDMRVHLSADVMARLDRISDTLGMPRATLAAVAIGLYVAQNEQSRAMVDQVAQMMGRAAQERVENVTDGMLLGL